MREGKRCIATWVPDIPIDKVSCTRCLVMQGCDAYRHAPMGHGPNTFFCKEFRENIKVRYHNQPEEEYLRLNPAPKEASADKPQPQAGKTTKTTANPAKHEVSDENESMDDVKKGVSSVSQKPNASGNKKR